MLKNKPTAAWQFLDQLDILCFSHLRWNFVYQRPQHLLSRFAKHTRVFVFEEPVFHDKPQKLHVQQHDNNVWVVVPHLPQGLSPKEVATRQKRMVNSLISKMKLERFVSWYYTPMSL